MPSAIHQVFATAYGFAAVGWISDDIVSFRLPAPRYDLAERALLKRLPGSTAGDAPEAVRDTIRAAQRYFDGERQAFSGVRVALGEQEPLFIAIYDAVRRLGWGETTTYGAVAKSLGAGPEAARTVGEAMARNPVPLIIPCHRVLAAGGQLGGFSAPGGSASKAHMLELEGAIPASQSSAQTSFGF